MSNYTSTPWGIELIEHLFKIGHIPMPLVDPDDVIPKLRQDWHEELKELIKHGLA